MLQAQARVVHFTQHHADQLNLSMSALENFLSEFSPGCDEATARGHLGKFGVSGEMALKPCAMMSGGQKSRVVFAMLTYRRPHIVRSHLIRDLTMTHPTIEYPTETHTTPPTSFTSLRL